MKRAAPYALIVFAGLAMFLFVFLKAFQQRNVAGSHYLPVVPTSVAMAITEVYIIAIIVRVGYDPLLVACIGTGSGLGCLLAMHLHDKIFGKLRQ